MKTNSVRIAEELAANSAWLRRLAGSLVDDGSADDLVQDTMIAALRRPPALDRPIRPWLRTVLGNMARLRWRSESRRKQREQDTPAPDQPSQSESNLAKLQMHKELVEAVMELEEIYRETIIMRFVDDLSAAEIARRCDVPAATVRSRLKRALEMLRLELDRRSDGDRQRWRAAMIPLLVPANATGAVASSTAAAIKVVIAVTMAAMILAAFLVLRPLVAQEQVEIEIAGLSAPSDRLAGRNVGACTRRADAAEQSGAGRRLSQPRRARTLRRADRGGAGRTHAAAEDLRLLRRAGNGDGAKSRRPAAGHSRQELHSCADSRSSAPPRRVSRPRSGRAVNPGRCTDHRLRGRCGRRCRWLRSRGERSRGQLDHRRGARRMRDRDHSLARVCCAGKWR